MKKRINLSASSLVGEMEGLGGPLGARVGVFEGTRAFGSPGRPLEIGEGSLWAWGSFGSLGAFEDQGRAFGGSGTFGDRGRTFVGLVDLCGRWRAFGGSGMAFWGLGGGP